MVNLVLLVQFDETGKGIHGPDSRLSGRVSDQQLKSVDCVCHPVAKLCQSKLKGVVEKNSIVFSDQYLALKADSDVTDSLESYGLSNRVFGVRHGSQTGHKCWILHHNLSWSCVSQVAWKNNYKASAKEMK